jgi:GntR family transcriptional regulator/MocR family aminotransferase
MRRTKFTLAGWRLDAASTQVLYRHVCERLREAIRGGQLKPNERLPSARALASQLGTARGTIELAYTLLAAEGYVVGRGAAGTFVAHGLASPVLRRRRRVTRLQPPSESAAGPPRSALPLQLGLPSLDRFPRTVWSRLVGRRARTVSPEDLAGEHPQGHLPLRKALAAYLAVSRGVLCEPEQIIITGGFQGALGLVSRAFLSPGNPVCFEEPGYTSARLGLLAAGAEVIPVRVDSEGLNIEAALKRAPDARMICVTPAHQAPTGVSLSLARRLALLAWATQHGGWILEDDYDSEFRYDSRPLPALKSLDDAGRVLYIGTFSKVLFPALRLGYLVVPSSEVPRVAEVNRLLYGAAPRLMQTVVADFMAEGHFPRHIRKMRTLYRERRSALVTAVTEIFQGDLHIRLASGGMHLIVQGKPLENDRAIVINARKAGLAPSALSSWYHDPRDSEYGLLLGFTNLAADQAVEVMTRLKSVLGRPSASVSHRDVDPTSPYEGGTPSSPR